MGERWGLHLLAISVPRNWLAYLHQLWLAIATQAICGPSLASLPVQC